MNPIIARIKKELCRFPCGDLLSIARSILVGKRKVRVPGVRQCVFVRMFKKKMRFEVSMGCFKKNRIKIYLGNNRNNDEVLMTLVHEMRHAQQRDILGHKRFDIITGKINKENSSILAVLESDAQKIEAEAFFYGVK